MPYTFFKKSKLKKVDLTVNQIEAIDRNALRLSDLDNQPQALRPQFLFGGNPIKCDCHMAWFKSINQLDDDGKFRFSFIFLCRFSLFLDTLFVIFQ